MSETDEPSDLEDLEREAGQGPLLPPATRPPRLGSTGGLAVQGQRLVRPSEEVQYRRAVALNRRDRAQEDLDEAREFESDTYNRRRHLDLRIDNARRDNAHPDIIRNLEEQRDSVDEDHTDFLADRMDRQRDLSRAQAEVDALHSDVEGGDTDVEEPPEELTDVERHPLVQQARDAINYFAEELQASKRRDRRQVDMVDEHNANVDEAETVARYNNTYRPQDFAGRRMQHSFDPLRGSESTQIALRGLEQAERDYNDTYTRVAAGEYDAPSGYMKQYDAWGRPIRMPTIHGNFPPETMETQPGQPDPKRQRMLEPEPEPEPEPQPEPMYADLEPEPEPQVERPPESDFGGFMFGEGYGSRTETVIPGI